MQEVEPEVAVDEDELFLDEDGDEGVDGEAEKPASDDGEKDKGEEGAGSE